MNGYIDAIILENIEMELSTFFMRDPTNRAVAWVNGQIVNEKQFFLDVEKFRIVFSNRNIHRVALFCQDTYRFACALFGAWQANVLTVLPTDMTEHTQSKLKDDVDAFVFDNGKPPITKSLTLVKTSTRLNLNRLSTLKQSLLNYLLLALQANLYALLND